VEATKNRPVGFESDLVASARGGNFAGGLCSAIRVHHWSKNLLVLVPVLTSHTYRESSVVVAGLVLLLAWSLAASGSYLINDLIDLEADQADPVKQKRAVASGRLSARQARIAASGLIVSGLALAAAISWETILVLAIYVVVAQSYSLFFRQRMLLDVFVLAFLYTIRVIGGGIATGNHVTIWLLAFASFIFLGLALLKRCAELIRLNETSPGSESSRRAYRTSDLPLLQTFGIASSFLSVLILSLYVDSHVAETTYSRPHALWAVVPLLLLWLCRLWMKTSRGEMHHDPIVFSMRDRGSWLIGMATLVAIGIAVV